MDNTLEIICASCQATFEETAQTVIDSQAPGLKAAVLQDELNALECPHCQTGVQPLTPLYYYDLEKKLALVLVPEELGLSKAEQEEAIAEVTKSGLNSLPTKQRIKWLKNPHVFTAYGDFLQAIFTADGITSDMLGMQQKRAQLIEEFMPLGDPKMFAAKVDEHKAELDTAFFSVLTTYMQTAQMQGDEVNSRRFLKLRSRLGRSSPERQAIIDELDEQLGLTIIQDPVDLLEKLEGTENKSERKALIAAGFDLVDDEFFDMISKKFEHATKTNDNTAEKFYRGLRNDIVELKEAHSDESRVALEKAEVLFKEVIQADAPDQVLQEKVEHIEETFFFVLGTNIAKARQQGQDGVVQALEMIGQVATGLLQERQAALQTK